MRRFCKGVLALSCAAVSLFGLSACGNKDIKATVLGIPKEATTISYADRESDKVKAISASAEKFAAEFSALAYKDFENDSNFAVAPVSVYMALSLAAQCADGDTRFEILSALGVSYNQLADGFSDYYRSLFAEYKREGKLIGTITFSNSVWLDNCARAKQNCIDVLADKFNCYSYNAGFCSDNAAANAAIRKFVKDNTHGLIDKNFKLGKETLFALINTLYLKDIWNSYGNDLRFTEKEYGFKNIDATETKTKLLQGDYFAGRVYEGENYKTFFTSTGNGNRIKFILPDDGYMADDIFTAENLSRINAITDYNASDEVNKIKYYTRCLFPEFSAEYDKDIKELLKNMGINDMFSAKDCNYTTLTDDEAFCSRVIHATKLKVDKSGIEGAAVTVVANDASAASPDNDYKEMYSDFIIDRAFGFILSDAYGNTLFSGVVKKV